MCVVFIRYVHIGETLTGISTAIKLHEIIQSYVMRSLIPNKDINMSSSKSSENIQRKEDGPDSFQLRSQQNFDDIIAYWKAKSSRFSSANQIVQNKKIIAENI